MSVAVPSPQILAAIARGSTILTPAQRPARNLRLAYDRHMHAAGHTLWNTPPIFALDTWLSSLWRQLILSGDRAALLLNRSQQHLLWRNLIAADRATASLRSHSNPDALATLAVQAWETLCLHQGHPRLDESAATPDSRAFVRWSRTFARICERRDYITPSQLPAALQSALAEAVLPLPAAGLTLVDFDLRLPAHESLLHAVASTGYPVEPLTSTLPAPALALYPAPDPAAELRAAANWAREALERDPATRIAIVVPSLAQRRPVIERAFTTAFPTPSTFEFSLGTPLDRTAPIATALDLLRWTLEPLPAERVRTLLLSSAFGPQTPAEASAIATFEANALQQPEGLRPQHTLVYVARQARLAGSAALRPFADRLHRLRSTATELLPPAESALRRPFAHWTHIIRTLLVAAGWTVNTRGASVSFQIQRRWESVLDEAATLDFEGTPVTFATALEAVARIARGTIFAPESHQAPIQILGPLELGGIPFDALWFLSADDTTWPPSTPVTPLLSRTLQRQLHIPGTDSVSDTRAASILTRRIAASASQAIFSYAALSNEGEGRPSPLLRELDLQTLPPSLLPPPPPPAAYENFCDDLPVTPLPPGHISGGAAVLELQAACPFRAFAERRLYAGELDTPEPGLDPAQRGSLAHHVMQVFWQTLKSQDELRELSLTRRHAVLESAIEQALKKHADQQLTPWDIEYLAIQRYRLTTVLRPWIEAELERPGFTITALEQKLSAVAIGPLHLDLRVDRIDQTPGGALIIDYKTGAANPKQWTTDRPEKPQLPLYAIADPASPPAGIAFAMLRAHEKKNFNAVAAAGVLQSSTRSPGDFPARLAEWSIVLEKLAYDFASGHAAVDPRLYPATCQHCTQRTLCRLNMHAVDDLSDEDDPPTEGDSADG